MGDPIIGRPLAHTKLVREFALLLFEALIKFLVLSCDQQVALRERCMSLLKPVFKRRYGFAAICDDAVAGDHLGSLEKRISASRKTLPDRSRSFRVLTKTEKGLDRSWQISTDSQNA